MKLIEGIDAENLLADKGYSADALTRPAFLAGMLVIIPRSVVERFNKNIAEAFINRGIL